MNLVDGLHKYDYIGNDNHILLSLDAGKNEGPNIGKNGENLTISFLSLNRASLSIKLLESIQTHIPHFLGEVLIIDNGSDENEILLIEEFCEELSFSTRIVKLDKNHGVAGGRNRTMPYVKTEWLMCLDNDIYFTDNPLVKIQKDIAILGTHFLNLPLLDPDGKTLFAFGGHIYVDFSSGELHIGAGSAYQQEIFSQMDSSFLCTFLFGGASVLNVKSFNDLGGYDENMFVGFEDIDFSIRLFQAGMKVASTTACTLIHDHPAPTSQKDVDYEKERFSKQVIYDSARYMEKKHGFTIWNDAVGSWLDSRHDELGIKTEKHSTSGKENIKEAVSLVETIDNKSCIALIIDTDNWAFDNIAKQIKKNLSHLYHFKIIPMDIMDNIYQVFLLTQECDMVHFFWRGHLSWIDEPYNRIQIEQLGLSYESFKQNYIFNKKITTGVFDHLYLSPLDIEEKRTLFNSLISGYTVSSKKLFEIYKKIPNYPNPVLETPDGVDLNIFTPKNLERLQKENDSELVIGWVGNSLWASELEDSKGFQTILKPALAELVSEGLKIQSNFADKQQVFIPHSKMPDYYSKIDIYICVSQIEGTPNPVLEAMACGVPVISTDVGIVPEVFGPLQKEYILQNRSIKDLKEKIKEIYYNKDILLKLSNENLESIKHWNWSMKVLNYQKFFEKILHN